MHNFIYFVILFCIFHRVYQTASSRETGREDQSIPYIKEFCVDKFDKNESVCVFGMTTRKQERCVPLKHFKKLKHKALENAAFCIKESNYWCAVTGNEYDWDYCPWIACHGDASSACIHKIRWTSTSSSINLLFPEIPDGTAIISVFYTNESHCVTFPICKSCSELEILEDRFSICQKLSKKYQSSYFITLLNLLSETVYKFYLIPIINGSSIGPVAILSLSTTPNNPTVSTSVAIQWISTFKPHYSYTTEKSIVNVTDEITDKNVYKSTVMPRNTSDNIISCTNYCIHIQTFISFNESAVSEPFGCIINANIDNIELDPVKCRLPFSEHLFWKYDKYSNCSVKFGVEFSNLGIRNSLSKNFTTSRDIRLSGMLPNATYEMIIRPEFNNESGNYNGFYKFIINGNYINETLCIQSNLEVPTPKRIPLSYIAFLLIPILVVIFYFVFHKGHSILCQKKIITVRESYSINPINQSLIRVTRYSTMTEASVDESNESYVSAHDSFIINEFEYLCCNSEKLIKTNNLTTEIANLPSNIEKNRYTNILPFDHNRVILKKTNSESDYINASFIPFENDESVPEYIACQGPLFETNSDFWQMIWEQNVCIIIMLTENFEGMQEKCYKYWPNLINDASAVDDMLEFEITLENEFNEHQFIVERNIKLKHKTSFEEKYVLQLQLNSWSDFSIPTNENIERFIYHFKKITASNKLFPYLVHCSAGVGRTGTFIVLLRVIEKIENGFESINIYEEVLSLRKHRKYMVQQRSQYIFIHKFVQYYLKQKYDQERLKETKSQYEAIYI